MSTKKQVLIARLGALRRNVVKWTFGVMFTYASCVDAAFIDLNNFYHESGAPVSVSADRFSATFAESADFNVVFLSNIPGLGDPEIIVAQPGARLQFNYQFSEPSGNLDVFHAALLDGNSGMPLGSAFEFFSSDSSAGLVQFDLTSLVGTKLGLQFELVPEFSDTVLTSTLTLSNLQVVPVPLPAAGVLMLSGMLLFSGLTTLGKKVRCRTRSTLHI